MMFKFQWKGIILAYSQCLEFYETQHNNCRSITFHLHYNSSIGFKISQGRVPPVIHDSM